MQNIDDLIEPVTEAIGTGALKWQEEASSSFSVRLPKHILDVWTGVDDDDGSSWVSIALRDRGAGNQVLDTTTASQFSPRYDRLLRFFQTARRSALNVDAVISSIKQDLVSLGRAKAS